MGAEDNTGQERSAREWNSLLLEGFKESSGDAFVLAQYLNRENLISDLPKAIQNPEVRQLLGRGYDVRHGDGTVLDEEHPEMTSEQKAVFTLAFALKELPGKDVNNIAVKICEIVGVDPGLL